MTHKGLSTHRDAQTVIDIHGQSFKAHHTERRFVDIKRQIWYAELNNNVDSSFPGSSKVEKVNGEKNSTTDLKIKISQVLGLKGLISC